MVGQFTLPQPFESLYPKMLAIMRDQGNGISFSVLETYGFMWYLYLLDPSKGGYILYKVSTERQVPITGEDGVPKYDIVHTFGGDEYTMMRDLRRGLRNASGNWYIWNRQKQTFESQGKVNDITYAYNDVRAVNPLVNCVKPATHHPNLFRKQEEEAPERVQACSGVSGERKKRILSDIALILLVVTLILGVTYLWSVRQSSKK